MERVTGTMARRRVEGFLRRITPSPHAIDRVYHALGSHHTYCPQCDRFHSDGCAPWRAKRA